MKFVLAVIFLAMILAVTAYADDESCDMLFVQDARAMSFDGARLTLKGANPNIIFFLRPSRADRRAYDPGCVHDTGLRG